MATTKRYSLSYSIPDHLGRSSGEEGCAHVAVAPSPEGRCQLTRSMQHHLPSIFSLNVVFVTQGRRAKLSAKQRIGMWRWKAGQSLQEIGRAFGKDHVSIQFMSSQHGGIAPAAHWCSLLMLTLAEREDISRRIASGWSIREIAKGWSGLCRRLAERWRAMAGGCSIARVKRITKPGSWPCDPSGAFRPSTRSRGRSLRVNES